MKRDHLDALFSLWVRRRDHFTCQRCGKRYPANSRGLHCAHVFSRGRQSVRFSPINALVLCYGCHRLCDQNKERVLYPLYIRLYGQAQFDLLRLRANTPKKPDRALIGAWLKAELETQEPVVRVLEA